MSRHYIGMPLGRGALVARRVVNRLGEVKAIVFDCDGVLIDVRGSYERAIKETVKTIFSKLFHVEFLGDPVGPEQIAILRRTGGFNNDADTAYILSLWLFVNLPLDRIHAMVSSYSQLGVRPDSSPDRLAESMSRAAISRDMSIRRPVELYSDNLEEIVVAASQGKSIVSMRDVEEQIRSYAARRGITPSQYEIFKNLLGYPGRYGKSLLQTVFDDLYYGASFIKNIHGEGPYFEFGDGLFQNEQLNIRRESLESLTEILGARRLGLATGRDSITTKLVLGELLEFFEPRACVFILDELRAGKSEEISKPSPYSLIKSCMALGVSSEVIYVGNSMEDLIMARQARSYGLNVYFAAVTNLSHSPQRDMELLLSRGAEIIIDSPDDLPRLLEAARGSA